MFKEKPDGQTYSVQTPDAPVTEASMDAFRVANELNQKQKTPEGFCEWPFILQREFDRISAAATAKASDEIRGLNSRIELLQNELSAARSIIATLQGIAP